VIQTSEAPAAGVDDGDAEGEEGEEGEGGEGGVRYGGIDDGFNVAPEAVGNRCLGIDAGEPYTETLVNQRLLKFVRTTGGEFGAGEVSGKRPRCRIRKRNVT
jgi:hypothetical protein